MPLFLKLVAPEHAVSMVHIPQPDIKLIKIARQQPVDYGTNNLICMFSHLGAIDPEVCGDQAYRLLGVNFSRSIVENGGERTVLCPVGISIVRIISISSWTREKELIEYKISGVMRSFVERRMTLKQLADELMNSRFQIVTPDSWEFSIADQIALDDALVAPADRLKIGKCNLRLSSDVSSKEATLQVVYDVLKLTSFYKAFQVTANAPEIYMQEF
ncbi:hypothetical protein Tco_0857035 [Tanacetum coccineum]|uniref:Uncharacterized protein n=1 Tax=Tanacetum coccineum TaxID=301880 RepID=A0ABQ5B8Z1_9ASTR